MSLAGFASSSCTHQGPPDNGPTPVLSGPPATNFPMPPLKSYEGIGWVLVDGTRTTLAAFEDNVLVLDFYATWCAPCRKSIPRLSAMQENYGPRGVRIVGLNVGGPDDRIKVANFATELKIQYPLGFPDKALTDLFFSGDQQIPQTFVFGRDGQLKGRFVGYDESTGDAIEKMISDLANNRP